jgi:methylenetetrahydrofolate--tRNA-(uracil-5-)-methyltransferase
MRPQRSTPAHKTGDLAELVCSNSLRSDDPQHAAGLLKREMEAFGSLIIAAARDAAVPAGSALAVDRDRFAAAVTGALERHPRIELRRQEVTELPAGEVVIATGPLTSEAMTERIREVLGSDYLYFYDAIAPIIDIESLDLSKLWWASRYDKGGADYLNAAMDREQYARFYEALVSAEVLPLHDFEKGLFFEGCLPIEELARRGVDTLRFGPMKPVGLTPPGGERPWAVVQLRQENLAKSHLNMVGFQSRMKWGEQKRVLGLIPGLENAEYVRMGQIHRNTFINSPTHLDPWYRIKNEPRLRLAGQLTGVEGYLESAATGLAIGLYIALERASANGSPASFQPTPFPATMALGMLSRHLTESDPKRFQPANVNYGLFEPLPGRIKKRERRAAYAARARRELIAWASHHGVTTVPEATVPEAPDPEAPPAAAEPPFAAAVVAEG